MRANQKQVASIFSVNSQAITKHIKNIYEEKELLKNQTCSNLEQVQIEGKKLIKVDKEFKIMERDLFLMYQQIKVNLREDGGVVKMLI